MNAGVLLARADRGVAMACRVVVVSCLLGLFALLSFGIAQRFVPQLKIAGYDELIELLFAWMTFSGALALWREGVLYRVDMLDRVLPDGPRRWLGIAVHASMAAVAVMLAVVGTDFVRQSGESTPFLGADKAYWYAAIPVTASLMSVYSFVAVWRCLRYGAPEPAAAGAGVEIS
jgi:TRAP-type C4-dicarboxylate transport system permease small subunit